MFNQTLETLSQNKHLSEESAFCSFSSLFSGELSPAQSGAFLMGLRLKGETPIELKSAVQAALTHAVQVKTSKKKTIDTCGTGGDGKKSFNCSTAVALFLADMGYQVVKHGNRAVSSSCGSADIIHALNIPFVQDQMEVEKNLAKSNFVFLFAPYFHPAFAHVAPIRKELGISTLFNLLGPLLNPARPTHQLLGVGQEKYLDLVAQTLSLTGIQKAAVVHDSAGFDEITPCGKSKVIFVSQGSCQKTELDPFEFDFTKCKAEDLICQEPEQSMRCMQSILSGVGPEAMQDMVALNLGMALYLLEEDQDLRESMRIARQKVDQGIKGRVGYAQ